ncbi:MAG: hypothetical protein ACLGHQ_05190, partial [Acidimicrobiia bacterium]
MMRSLLRQFRRAPGRIVASIFALALAVGAIGVLAVPTVSEGTLHEAVARDGLPDLIMSTTPLDRAQVDAIAALDNIAAVEGQATLGVVFDDGSFATLIGLELPDHTMDRIQLTAGRLPV